MSAGHVQEGGGEAVKPILFNTSMVRAILDGRKTVTRRAVKREHLRGLEAVNAITIVKNCNAPYHPGDILYVREAFSRSADGYAYKADEHDSDGWGWRPSIHMPREAARIFLRVTTVRVEMLHQITNDEIQAEGVKRQNLRPGGCSCTWKTETCINESCGNRDGYEAMCWYIPFSELWDSTIKPTDRVHYGWLSNPWVWVVRFERISKEDAG